MTAHERDEHYGIHPSSSESDGTVPQSSESVGNVPNPSEPFRDVPQDADAFGTVQNSSEVLRNDPNDAEQQLSHTLTVREVARMFENAGVPRTERSIVNWCQPNRQGMVRLDCYFDPNERKYFISPASVDAAIKEEQAKENRSNRIGENTEQREESRQQAQDQRTDFRNESEEQLRSEIRDLKIATMVKDQMIENLEKQNNSMFEDLKSAQYTLGRLEERLQLSAPDLKSSDEQGASAEEINVTHSP